MLLTLLYHRIGKGKYANAPELFCEHLRYIKEHFSVVLPGEFLPKRKLSLCLSFDDATYDFYHYVFPLLKSLNLRALLGVPTRYIVETTTVASHERLAVPYTLAMQDGFHDTKIPFCTWQELEEMVTSGHVEVASHSYMHCNLTFPFVDLEREVIRSKEMIEARLPQAVSSFIYPFGKTNKKVHAFVSKYYPYSFRIGSRLNFGWGDSKKPLFRILGDQLSTPRQPFAPLKIAGAFLKSLI